jgi:hypothetical protein
MSPPTSGQQVERLEKGLRQIDTDWIEKIAKAFDVDPVALLAGQDPQFELTPQVASEVAEHLARVVLAGVEPPQEIVQDLAVILLELSETFVRHPQARRDPQVTRPVMHLLTKRRAQQ